MSEKRRDNKGRLLQNGELQRSDGRYEYRYYDLKGERHSIYSWRLTDKDKTPPGKRKCKPLRDMIRAIERDLYNGVDPYEARNMTLNELWDKYMETREDLRRTTRTAYIARYNKHIRDRIGQYPIIAIRYSDIKRLYVQLIKQPGFSPSSIGCVHAILHPTFELAVRDELIRRNPTDYVMREIKRGYDLSSQKCHTLTEAQQTAFMSFVSQHSVYQRWVPLFTLLLGTGCRIGEAAALRWQDCDFHNRIIHIRRTLGYSVKEDGSGYNFYISPPKTKAGVRDIPMLDVVRRTLLTERMRQTRTGGFNRCVVDGYSGFIFSGVKGNMLQNNNVNTAIKGIIHVYNKEETKNAQNAGRKPVLLPNFSVHSFRHTFCTRFCENETDLKIIQEIMGHSDIAITMNIYNEATQERKVASFENLEGKIKII